MICLLPCFKKIKSNAYMMEVYFMLVLIILVWYWYSSIYLVKIFWVWLLLKLQHRLIWDGEIMKGASRKYTFTPRYFTKKSPTTRVSITSKEFFFLSISLFAFRTCSRGSSCKAMWNGQMRPLNRFPVSTLLTHVCSQL
jgi:hypothetical protein